MNNNITYTNTPAIIHSGILGMKWGIRRYQNKDGTLTEAGKRRYSKLKGELDKLGGETAAKASKNSTPDVKKTDVKKMSDEELKTAVNRLLQEQQYKKLTGQDKVEKTAADYLNSFKDNLINDISKKASEAISKKIVDQFVGSGGNNNDKGKDKEKDKNKDKNKNDGGGKSNKQESVFMKILDANDRELKTRANAEDNRAKNRNSAEKLKLERDKFEAERQDIARANAKEDRAEKEAKQAKKEAKQAEKKAERKERQRENRAAIKDMISSVQNKPLSSVPDYDWDDWMEDWDY